MLTRLKHTRWIFDIGLRRMSNDGSPGWGAQMLVFSLLALAMMAWLEIGIGVAWGVCLISTLDVILTQHFVRRAIRQIRRLGVFGPTRARWWIELSALVWTLCFSCEVFFLAQASGLALQPWPALVLDVVMACGKFLFFAFLVLTVVSFLLGLVQGKRIRGRSLELVSYFFWTIVVIGAAIFCIPDNPDLGNVIAPICAVLGIAALVIASLTAAWQAMTKSTDDI